MATYTTTSNADVLEQCVNTCMTDCLPASCFRKRPPNPPRSTSTPTSTPTSAPTSTPTSTPTSAPTSTPTSTYKMTQSFPLGNCKMGYPSLPYSLTVADFTPGVLCLNINLVPNYQELCAARKLSAPCDMMVKNVNKIVFWYNQIPECGFEFTNSKKSLSVFPWKIKYKGNIINAARYRVIAANETIAHAAGDVSLFKWEWNEISSVQLDVDRSTTFRKAIDETMNGYRLCFNYDPDALDIVRCMTNERSVLQYSFYDPYKSICTQGSLRILV